jgi:hypothetical protein
VTILDDANEIWAAIYNRIDTNGSWEGSLSEVSDGFGWTKARFDKAWRFLKVSECIEFVRSGNRFTQTLVRLVRPPTDDDFQIFLLTDSSVSGKIEQRLNDLARLIGGVNLIELEARVAQLEHKLNTTEGDQE